MKKIKVTALILALIMVVSTAIYYLYPIVILDDLKLRRAVGGGHHLILDGQNLGYISGLDSWYIEGSQVYGSMTYNKNKTNKRLSFFYVDVCVDEILITDSRNTFKIFLDHYGINRNRRNYMSGNNLINMKKFDYSSTINCS